MLVNVAKLVTAYYTGVPDHSIAEQKISFGTSGHRGSAFSRSFNEWHVLVITQAICQYRKRQGIDGPLFLGVDTHALSVPAFASELEVLAVNGVEVMLAENDEYTPTPVISHAILTYNRGRDKGLADGIVITPSHNPPDHGGFKYNPPNGGPADTGVTGWIEAKANEFLKDRLQGVKRMPFEQALRAATTHRHGPSCWCAPTAAFPMPRFGKRTFMRNNFSSRKCKLSPGWSCTRTSRSSASRGA